VQATEPSRCPACLAVRTRRAFEAGGQEFKRCRSCHTLFVDPPPSAEDTRDIYADRRYFLNPRFGLGDHYGYKDYLADRDEIEEKFAGILGQIENYVPTGELLDLGSGPGLLVAVANARGWNARGLDLNPWAVEYAQAELGQPVEHGSLEEAQLPEGSLDALTMMDVIEHVPDPNRLLEHAARVIRVGGVLAVLTPDAGSPVTRVLGRRWPEPQRGIEHAVLFSVRGLSQLLKRHGFEAAGWHSIGKVTTLQTLVADVAPAAPKLARAAQGVLSRTPLGRRRFDVDPRAKFCLYARRVEAGPSAAPAATELESPPRIRRRGSVGVTGKTRP
jgi:2-polyprenyl-3-methyl-5-hydroxy-6-metoxy-1,4-benzoquinol methylase